MVTNLRGYASALGAMALWTSIAIASRTSRAARERFASI
jgi:hypothetical protein